MSPRRRGGSTSDSRAAVGTGPGGRITRDDLEARFREVHADVVEEVEDEVRNYLGLAITAVVVTVAVTAFLLGRRRARKSRVVVQVRRVP